MFVRRALTRSKGSNHGVSYRLVHSTRIAPGKVRQVVLAYFRAGLEDRVPKSHWKLLAAQIRNLLAAQPDLPFPPESCDDPQLEQAIRSEAEAVMPLVRQRL